MAVMIPHNEQLKQLAGLSHHRQLFGPIASEAVHVFFSISGLLITYLFLQEHRLSGALSIRRFYARRALRILPLYALITLLAFFLVPLIGKLDLGVPSALVAKFDARLGSQGAAALGMYALMIPNAAYLWLPLVICGAHLWSIGVEEQFYALWPWLVKVSRRFLAVSLVTLFILNFSVLNSFVPGVDPSPRVLSFLKLFSLDHFLAGAGAALVLFHRPFSYSFLNRPWVAPLSLACMFGLMAKGAPSPLWSPLWSVGYAVLLFSIIKGRNSFVLLEHPVLMWLGKTSYGIYMWHPIAILVSLIILSPITTAGEVAQGGLAIFLTLAIAGLSYQWIERPFLRRKRRFASPAGVPL